MGIRSVGALAVGLLLGALVVTPQLAQAGAGAGAEPAASARLIIKLRPNSRTDTDARRQILGHTDRVRNLAARSRLSLRGSRDLGNGLVGIGLTATLAGAQLDEKLAALRADPEIEFAVVDRRRYARAMPTDTLFASQWYLQGVEIAATNFEVAWNTTTGAGDTVIAVLDTGILFSHPDLAGRVLPGYDFVSGESASSFVGANDGNDWDSDAADPGDWVSTTESLSGPLAGCDVEKSSWHGTRVAAMVGATTNNAAGVAGGTWSGSVLPVRVLGKCGGYDSDIIAGMRWAAGLPVSGVPTNPNPASIVNMSLGGVGSCDQAYRDVVAELNTVGVLVVASAGNEGGPVEAPANCPGALAVGGLRHVGTKVGFSSFGSQIGVSAPGGNCPDEDTTFLCSFSLITATDTGFTAPESFTYTDERKYNIGTSFSAPIVSAVAGLMHAANDELTTTELIARIKASARPFPAPEAGLAMCPSAKAKEQCNCTTSTCGAGIADAPGAIAAALRPMARVTPPVGTGAGTNVTLIGTGSGAARGRTISYAWTGVSGNPAFVGATNGSTVTVAVPASGQVRVRLAVTDDLGRSDTSEVTLGAVAAGGGGGGGGGMTDPLVLLALGLLLGRRRYR